MLPKFHSMNIRSRETSRTPLEPIKIIYLMMFQPRKQHLNQKYLKSSSSLTTNQSI